MISPMVLSLDWASTQSNVVIHFGFNEGSLSTPDDWGCPVLMLFFDTISQLPDVLDDSVWMIK